MHSCWAHLLSGDVLLLLIGAFNERASRLRRLCFLLRAHRPLEPNLLIVLRIVPLLVGSSAVLFLSTFFFHVHYLTANALLHPEPVRIQLHRRKRLQQPPDPHHRLAQSPASAT